MAAYLKMAVVSFNEFGWIISQEIFFNKVYKDTSIDSEQKSFSFNPIFFDIKVPFKRSKKLHVNEKKKECESKVVRLGYEKLFTLFKFDNSSDVSEDKNISSAKDLADDFYNNLTRHPKNIPFNGGNISNRPLVTKIENEFYLIPPNSLFFCDDIRNINKYFVGEKFDFILLDPPWWNKYIRRKRKKNQCQGYGMFYDEELQNIKISEYLQDDGLVAVWCTNAPSHINSVLSVLFPSWGIKQIAQWYWMKVTKLGIPICDFSQPLGKQPYERIIFGVKENSNRPYKNPEENKIIMSVPSSIHSQKPPLSGVLKSYLPENPKSLELFSRYLLPNYTSFGNEVLKLQHASLFIEVG